MALDLPLPHNLLAHGHWTMDKLKMSKSRGNVANPFEAINLWGRDAMRVYLMRAGGNSAVDAGKCLRSVRLASTSADAVRLLADYSATEIENFYKKSLAGQLGNLLARISNTKLLNKLPNSSALWTSPELVESEDLKLVELLGSLRGASRLPWIANRSPADTE